MLTRSPPMEKNWWLHGHICPIRVVTYITTTTGQKWSCSHLDQTPWLDKGGRMTTSILTRVGRTTTPNKTEVAPPYIYQSGYANIHLFYWGWPLFFLLLLFFISKKSQLYTYLNIIFHSKKSYLIFSSLKRTFLIPSLIGDCVPANQIDFAVLCVCYYFMLIPHSYFT
jgi:hypothetical protein